MEKNVMYFASLAEHYYQKMVGDVDSAPEKFVLVDPLEKSCLIVPGYVEMKATDLLFKVKMVDGETVSEFYRYGVTIDEIIGMKNTWPTEIVGGIRIQEPAEQDGFYVYHELPPELKKHVSRYIFKLNSVEEMTDAFDEWGWGDENSRNIFEILKSCIEQVDDDAESGRFTDSFSVDVDRDGMMYPFVDFDFTHFEVAVDSNHRFVYVCYDFTDFVDDDGEE